MSWGVRKFSGGRQWYRTDRWQRLRSRVLSKQPFCAMRGQRERCRLVATEVDHIRPHRGDRRLFFDRANLQPMCRSCHAQKTAREVLGKGPGWDEHGMPLDPDHHWNEAEPPDRQSAFRRKQWEEIKARRCEPGTRRSRRDPASATAAVRGKACCSGRRRSFGRSSSDILHNLSDAAAAPR